MIFGYARVSTPDQNLDLQIDALKIYGISNENIYSDVASGVKQERKGLDLLLSKLRENDTIVVWKIDRIARSAIHLIQLVEDFQKQNIIFISIKEPFIDTSSSHGKFIFTLFSAVAQLERDLIKERTMAGIIAAKSRGRHGGRPFGLSKKSQKIAKQAVILYNNKDLTVRQICNMLDISLNTYYTILRHEGVEIGVY